MQKLSKNEMIKQGLKNGAEFTGVALVTIPGALSGDPFLITCGQVVGLVISKAFSDLYSKDLSNREELRIYGSTAYILSEISRRRNNQENLRTDGFFTRSEYRRTDAEEIFDAVLRKCKVEHEERKIILISNTFVNIAFEEGLSLSQSNHIIRLLESLSYSQICVLSYLYRKTSFNFSLSNQWLRTNEHLLASLNSESISIRQEIYEMSNLGLVECMNFEENSIDSLAMLSWEDVIPDGLYLTKLSAELCRISGIDIVDDNDVKQIMMKM